MALEAIKKIAINFTVALIVASVFASVAPSTAHKAYAFFEDKLGWGEPSIGYFTATPKDDKTAVVSYSILGNYRDVNKVLVYHKPAIPPQLGKPDKNGIYSYRAAKATQQWYYRATLLYYRYEEGSRAVPPELGLPNSEGVYSYNSPGIWLLAPHLALPLYYRFKDNSWQWTPHAPAWMPVTTTIVDNSYYTKGAFHGKQPAKEYIDIINYLNQNNPLPSSIKDVLPQLGEPDAAGVYIYRVPAIIPKTPIYYKFDGKAWQWTPYPPVWMPTTITTFNNPYDTTDIWHGLQPPEADRDIINYLNQYNPSPSLKEAYKSWVWSPDKKYWMPTSTTVVSGGSYKGEEPVKENRDIINYLEAAKPNPKGAGEQYNKKPCKDVNNIEQVEEISLTRANVVNYLTDSKGVITRNAPYKIIYNGNTCQIEEFRGWEQFSIEVYLINGNVDSTDVAIRVGVPVELGEPDSQGVYTYQAPGTIQIWYRHIDGKWQWTPYEPKENIWMPVTTTTVNSPGKKYHNKQPAKGANIEIINYLAKYNPLGQEATPVEYSRVGQETTAAAINNLKVVANSDKSFTLSWEVPFGLNILEKGGYKITHYYQRWPRPDIYPNSEVEPVNPIRKVSEIIITGRQAEGQIRVMYQTSEKVPDENRKLYRAELEKAMGKHEFEVELLDEKGNSLFKKNVTNGTFDDAYIETYAGGESYQFRKAGKFTSKEVPCKIGAVSIPRLKENYCDVYGQKESELQDVSDKEGLKKIKAAIIAAGLEYDSCIQFTQGKYLFLTCTPEEVDSIWKNYVTEDEYNCKTTHIVAEDVCIIEWQVVDTLNSPVNKGGLSWRYFGTKWRARV